MRKEFAGGGIIDFAVGALTAAEAHDLLAATDLPPDWELARQLERRLA